MAAVPPPQRLLASAGDGNALLAVPEAEDCRV